MADNWTPKTGKVIDSWTPKTGSIVSDEPITKTKPAGLPRYEQVGKEIAQRTERSKVAIEEMGKQVPILPHQFFGLGLGAAQIPIERVEAGLANIGLGIQERLPWSAVGAKSISGFRGEELGQFGDIPYRAGVPRPISSVIGLLTLAGLMQPLKIGKMAGRMVTSTAPYKEAGRELINIGKGISQIKNIIPKRQLLSREDKFLLQKSDDIYNVTQKAKGSIQQEYAGFRDATKDTPVDLVEINTNVKKLYGKTAKDVGQILPEEFTKEMKLIVNEAEGSNLGVVYKVKDTISKHIKPATWRKFKMGEQLTPDQEKLISSYFDFDKLIDTSLEKAGLVEEKQMLDYLNQKATDLYGVTGQVKKMVVDTLGKPQKTSAIKSVFLGQGDAGKKALFQQLSEFEPSILEITQGLEKYRNMQNIKRILTRAGIILGSGTLVGKGIQIGRELQRE